MKTETRGTPTFREVGGERRVRGVARERREGGKKSILAINPRGCGFAGRGGGVIFQVIDYLDARSIKAIINCGSLWNSLLGR